MADLESFIDKDKKEREEKERMIEKMVEYLKAQGYVVHTRGAYCPGSAKSSSYGTTIYKGA